MNRRHSRTRLALLVILALGALASLPGAAGAYVYWTNYGTDTIGRANLDGTGVDQNFIGGATDPVGVAVDGKHVYWAHGYPFDATIGRANLDGTGVDQTFITVDGYLSGVAVDANHVYWTNVHSEAGRGSIGRANLDGTGVDPSFIRGTTLPRGVAVDAGHVYWANWNSIGRANLDGGGADQSFIGGNHDFGGVAVDAGHVYWANHWAHWNSFGRANLDGTGVDHGYIDSTPGFRVGVAVDSGHVYWANTDTIGRANLDGTGANQSFVDAVDGGEGVAVDGLPGTALPDTLPPRTRITKGARNRSAKSEIKFRFTSPELGATFECRLDAKAYRACESPHQVKRLAVGKHHFRVRAIDAAGNVDPSAAKDKFEVDQATTNEGGRR